MWKKTNVAEPKAQPVESGSSLDASHSRLALIGESVSIQGELQGREDLCIEGKIEGKITISKGSVTIGERGAVRANIQATTIQVAGSVKGDLSGTERVVLLSTGRVEGNIKSKSVTLENGAKFKGSIDMETAGSAKPESSILPATTTASDERASAASRV